MKDRNISVGDYTVKLRRDLRAKDNINIKVQIWRSNECLRGWYDGGNSTEAEIILRAVEKIVELEKMPSDGILFANT